MALEPCYLSGVSTAFFSNNLKRKKTTTQSLNPRHLSLQRIGLSRYWKFSLIFGLPNQLEAHVHSVSQPVKHWEHSAS